MSNPIRKGTFRANINDVITDIFVKTSSDNVVVDKEGNLLSDYLTNLVLKDELSTALNDLKTDILDGAPEAYDTLKEISEYINTHEDVVTSIISALGNKADKEEVLAISNSLQTLADTVLNIPRIYYSVSEPSVLKKGDMWVQPVSGADVLVSMRQ